MSIWKCATCKRINKHDETCCDNPIVWHKFMTITSEEAQIEYLNQELKDYKKYVDDLLSEIKRLKQNHAEGLLSRIQNIRENYNRVLRKLVNKSTERFSENYRLKRKIKRLEEDKVNLLSYIEDLKELK